MPCFCYCSTLPSSVRDRPQKRFNGSQIHIFTSSHPDWHGRYMERSVNKGREAT